MMSVVLRLFVALFLIACPALAQADPWDDGFHAFVLGDYSKAHQLLLPLAQKRDMGAAHVLGQMYEKGNERSYFTQNYKEAAKWYRIAADQGHLIAQVDLGILYLEGKGVLQDAAEAEKWFRQAAERGYSRAQLALADLYTSGGAFPIDQKQAAFWYERAAVQGNPIGQAQVGLSYMKGWGVALDLVKAHMWFNLAASRLVPYTEEQKKFYNQVIEMRTLVSSKMTSTEIRDAQRLARDWKPKSMAESATEARVK
jgi:TPR repeat protein